jgi:hypothetical protein
MLQGFDHTPLELMYQDDNEETRNLYPLHSRAWTFQERLLSRRIVHFTPFELIWECRQAYWCECGDITEEVNRRPSWGGAVPKYLFYGYSHTEESRPSLSLAFPTYEPEATSREGASTTAVAFKDQGDTQQSVVVPLPNLRNMAVWMAIVNTFTTRKLTQESDRLPALPGIVKKFQSAGLGRYLAGARSELLPYYLAWELDNRYRPSRRVANPTWSWASVTGRIKFTAQPLQARTSVLDKYIRAVAIESLPCETGNLELTGPVLDRLLSVRGRYVKVAAYIWWLEEVTGASTATSDT